ncbi:MAG: GNAT family N-acetyltransferase [Flavobacteriaceae bacterium]
MNLSLTKCKVEQLDALLHLSRTTFIQAFAHLNDPDDFQSYMDEAFSDKTLGLEFKNPNSSFYFVYCNKQLAGYFKLNQGMAQTDLRDVHSLEIERIYVLQEFQGKGIGQWLLSRIKEFAQKEGKRYLWLGVWQKNNNAIRFYETHGYTKFGEHPYFIGKDQQTDWLMRLDITNL